MKTLFTEARRQVLREATRKRKPVQHARSHYSTRPLKARDLGAWPAFLIAPDGSVYGCEHGSHEDLERALGIGRGGSWGSSLAVNQGWIKVSHRGVEEPANPTGAQNRALQKALLSRRKAPFTEAQRGALQEAAGKTVTRASLLKALGKKTIVRQGFGIEYNTQKSLGYGWRAALDSAQLSRIEAGEKWKTHLLNLMDRLKVDSLKVGKGTYYTPFMSFWAEGEKEPNHVIHRPQWFKKATIYYNGSKIVAVRRGSRIYKVKWSTDQEGYWRADGELS